MGMLLDRIEERDGGAVLRSSGTALAEVARRLDAGERPGRIGAELRLEPLDVIAALGYLGLGPEGSLGPPLVQQAPPRPSWRAALAEPALAELLPGSSRPSRLALAAGLLQIHDFWGPSHEAAQEADDLGERATSAYWHGIGHRREPDPGNAAYWFRRVGPHALFGPLGRRASDLIAAQPDAAADVTGLVRAGTWDPFSFTNIARAVRPGSPAETLARRLQRLEMAMLLGMSAEMAMGRG